MLMRDGVFCLGRRVRKASNGTHARSWSNAAGVTRARTPGDRCYRDSKAKTALQPPLTQMLLP